MNLRKPLACDLCPLADSRSCGYLLTFECRFFVIDLMADDDPGIFCKHLLACGMLPVGYGDVLDPAEIRDIVDVALLIDLVGRDSERVREFHSEVEKLFECIRTIRAR